MVSSVNSDIKRIKELFDSTNPMDHVTAARKAPQFENLFVEKLMSYLNHDFYEVRAYSAKSLGQIGHYPAIKKIIPLLFDEVEEVRFSAAEALGYFSADIVIEPLLKVLSDHSREARRQAIKSLQSQDPGTLFNTIKSWLESINHQDYDMNTEEAITKIDVSRGIMEACGEFPFDWVSSVLDIGFNSPDLEMKRLSAIAIGKQADQFFVSKLLEIREHEDDDLRLAIIYALTNLTFENKLGILKQHHNDDYEFIRELLAKYLPQHYERSQIDHIVDDYLKDEAPFVRAALAGSLNDFVYLEDLKELLHDDYSSVRKEAVISLGGIDHEQSIELLRSIDEEDELVQIAIENALDNLTRS